MRQNNSSKARITTAPGMDTPLSQSYISLKLSEIQKRCSELMEEPEGLTELQLEESDPRYDNSDPYNHS
jgi:hypothetical protein